MARKSRKQQNSAPNGYLNMADAMVRYRAAAYIRQSSDGKRKPGDTLETQRDMIENYIAAAPDIELVEVYIDNKKSGTSFDRPAFQRMLKAIESGEINCVICKDLSRFGRNAVDSGYYLERHFPLHGIRFIAITDSYDSNEDDGGLMIPLKNIIAETYALDISRKCRAVNHQNKLDGRFIGRLAPYGYLKDPQDCHHLIVDPEASSIVRLIFDMASKGIGVGEICRHLNDTATLTPSRYRYAHGLDQSKAHVGIEHWTRWSVGCILSDPVYMGDMAQGRSRKEGDKWVKVPPEEWIVVQDTHEPIVSREQYERVRHLLKQNSQQDADARSAPIPYSNSVFKGKVFCARCGHRMTRKRQNKDGTYWFRCESQFRYSRNACVQVSVKENDLKTEVMALLFKQAEIVLGRYLLLERNKPSETNACDRELREINQTLSKSGLMLASLYGNMVDGLITKDEFVQLKADYKAQIDGLSSRANELREQKRTLEGEAAAQYSYADALSLALCNDSLTSGIIDTLIEKIHVNPDKSFTVYFRFRDEFTEVRNVV